MKKASYILFLAAFLFGLQSSTTRVNQMPDTRSVVKALYIYTFATLVEWPPEKRTGDFEIGVLGDITAVYEELDKKYSGRYIGSQKINIRNYPTIQDVEKSNGKCHILYITERKTDDLRALTRSAEQNNILLVAEKDNALDLGAVVNFMVMDNQQKYEINKTNARRYNLVIAKKLSDLAAKVIR